MLGSSETVGKKSGLFGNDSVYPKVQTEVYKKINELSGFHRLDDIYLSLIDKYMFPCLILNDRGEIVASSESADQYLKSSKGSIHQVWCSVFIIRAYHQNRQRCKFHWSLYFFLHG